MIDRVERAQADADPPPWWAVSVAGKLETAGDAGPTPGTGVTLEDTLTTFEAWRIRNALEEYAGRTDVPEVDAELVEEIVDVLDGEFEAAPPAIR